MNENIIIINGLSKRFKEAKVLEDINISFKKGKIYGLVGRNGSGKTMLLKCICGFILEIEGEIIVQGKKVGIDMDITSNIGVIIENPGFLPEYTAYQNLKLLSMIKKQINRDRIREVIQIVGLDPDSKKKVGKFSLGMKQRLGIAQAIMEEPDILLLDEPMNGLDDKGVNEIRKLFLQLKEQGKTIIMATHTKEDVERLCDEVIRMDQGKITVG